MDVGPGCVVWGWDSTNRRSGRTTSTPRSAAEARFRQAASVARQQGAKLWQLRAATRLARHWREQGRRSEAHDLLTPLYSQFTEGFGTPDLQAADAILRPASRASGN